ncbi:YaaA family protein [Microbacterium sp. A82]|uniref:YaaA family protein n=1 Tax=Microbacterium sp. A82 TaxID=3450452 RepID=UPI003F40A711
MKILLPPSETKRAGGDGSPLSLPSLALSALTDQREACVEALVTLAAEPLEARRVLKLSERQLGDIGHNAALRSAPTLPAIDRYTGVLYDAVDAAGLDADARAWLGRHVLIHSAPFGPVAALDAIPSYRLAAGASLPGVPPLRRLWADATTAALAMAESAFILDLRSEAYVALGPLPQRAASAYVRVVTEHGRALNHFNKNAKGELVRALAESRPSVRSVQSLIAWGDERGFRFRPSDDGIALDLVVDS